MLIKFISNYYILYIYIYISISNYNTYYSIYNTISNTVSNLICINTILYNDYVLSTIQYTM